MSESKVVETKEATEPQFKRKAIIELRLTVTDVDEVAEIIDALKAKKIRDEVETLVRIAANTNQVTGQGVNLNSSVEDSAIQIGLSYYDPTAFEDLRTRMTHVLHYFPHAGSTESGSVLKIADNNEDQLELVKE